MKYVITLYACDGSTEFELDLDERGVSLVEQMVDVSDRLGGGCSPWMEAAPKKV